VDITVRLLPVGNTTPWEIVALRTEVQDAVESLRGVERVIPVQGNAPEGARGIAHEIAAFLVALPSGIIPGVFQIIKSVVTRPAQPPVKVKVSAVGVDLEFDPGRISLDEMAQFVEQLRTREDAA
jgi:hypothetical protein